VHVLRDPVPGAEQGFRPGGCLCCASALFLVRCQGFRVGVYYAVRPRGIVSRRVQPLGSWDVVGGLRGCPFGAMSASCSDVARGHH
jgi:hypothetical protein